MAWKLHNVILGHACVLAGFLSTHRYNMCFPQERIIAIPWYAAEREMGLRGAVGDSVCNPWGLRNDGSRRVRGHAAVGALDVFEVVEHDVKALVDHKEPA